MSNTKQKTKSIRFANGQSENEVIAQYLAVFTETYDRLKPPDRNFVYNDEFLGEIEGLAGTDDEERAIYWLQGARRHVEHDERVTAALEDGWVDVEDLSPDERKKRPESVLVVGRGKVRDFEEPNGTRTTVVGVSTDWIEIPKGRVVYDTKSGKPTGVLPKGARSHGTAVTYRRVLVKHKPAVHRA